MIAFFLTGGAVCCGPGEPLHNNFVDLVRFNSQGKIAQMKEFFDSEHVHRHVDAHEKKHKQAEKK